MLIRLSRVLKGLPLLLRPSDEEGAVLVNHLSSLHLNAAARASDVGPRLRDVSRCVATSEPVRPTDTSFPARRGLGLGLRLVRAVDFGVVRLVGLDGGATLGTKVVFERDLLAVAVLTLFLGRSATGCHAW